MAFELEDFSRTGSLGKGGSLWMYTTDDRETAVLSTGYFNDVYSSLRVGDVIATSSFSDVIFMEVLTVVDRTVSVRPASAGIPHSRVIINSVEDFPEILDSTVQYYIDGTVDMGTRSLEVPAGGLHIAGLEIELSRIVSTEDNYTMFTSPVGGSGDILGGDLTMSASGVGSQIYDVVAATSGDDIQFVQISYANCTSLGTIDGYRQGLEDGSQRFGGTPTLTLKGAWSAGFRITTSIVRGLDSGMSEPLFKAGAGFTMASRFLTDINVDLPASASFADFTPTNFPNPSTLQVQGAIFTRNGVSDASDANYFTNITAASVSSSFSNNQGITNTFAGGRCTITSEVETVITTIDTFVPLLATQLSTDLQHFDSPSNGQLRHIGNSPREYTLFADKTLTGVQNNTFTLRVRKYDASTASFSTIYSQTRPINNLTGGRNVAFYTIMANVSLDTNDYVFFEVANNTDTTNVTAELDSFYIVQER